MDCCSSGFRGHWICKRASWGTQTRFVRHVGHYIVVCLFVCFSGPATDDKHCFDCLFVVSTINLLGPGRVFISSSSVTNNDDYNNYDNYEDYDDYHNYDDDYDNEYNDYDDDYDIL